MYFKKFEEIEWEGKYPDLMITFAVYNGMELTDRELDDLNDDSQLVYELILKFKV